MKPQQKPIQHLKHQKFPSSSTPNDQQRPGAPGAPRLWCSRCRRMSCISCSKRRSWTATDFHWSPPKGRPEGGNTLETHHGKTIDQMEKKNKKTMGTMAKTETIENLTRKKLGEKNLPNWKIGQEKTRKKMGGKKHRRKLALGVLKKNTGICPKLESRSQPVLEPVVSHHQAQGSCEELAAGLILRFKPMVFFPDLIPEISMNVLISEP